ncbi:hypothetical protein FH972_021502 [Carpinus fangiana]|uniref:Gnk2-homologous domain-containing protein n=1 Tax=Carpinus fangiana TaxID=176857 RepID=A0A5N6KQ61_9ROSI|nr:hypothetical protein FH972_021502 [Carpinus fangiana]
MIRFVEVLAYSALFFQLASAIPPCYTNIYGDPTQYWISNAPYCTSPPSGVKPVPPKSATELIETYKPTSGSAYEVTFKPTKVTATTVIVATNTQTTVTSTASPGDTIWVPIPIIVPPGAPPIPPVPPEIPYVPEVVPVETLAPSACKQLPVEACHETISTSFYVQDYKIVSSTASLFECRPTSACSTDGLTSTTTVPYSAVATPSILLDSQVILNSEPRDIDNPSIDGDAPGMITFYHNLLNIDSNTGPIGEPICSPSSPNIVQQAEATDNVHDFCSFVSGNEVTLENPGLNSKEYIQQNSRGQQVTINVAYNQANNSDCPSNKHFEYFVDTNRCNDIYGKVISGCNDGSTTTTLGMWAHRLAILFFSTLLTTREGGKISDQCADFSFNTASTDELTCDGKVLGPNLRRGINPSTFGASEATDAINKFCSTKGRYLSPDGNPNLDDGGFCASCADELPNAIFNYDKFNVDVYVYYDQGKDQGSCKPQKKFYFTDVEDDCKRLLSMAVNGCKYWRFLLMDIGSMLTILVGNTDTQTEKWGGEVYESQGPDGCVHWAVYGWSGASGLK